ncbi:3-oxoacyl-[acyl-carrier protein] reductase [Devosia sp. DBB001]|nr:3-oxoacyl-[acyl-carrier protein] reductase [Devosia sp. DBB001]
MLLKDKVAVIYGAGGHIGGAVARALARDGAEVFLTGRHRDKVERIAADIAAAGGKAHVAEVDATDKAAIEQHLADLIAQTGQLDISFNAISVFGHLQGTPMVEMTEENFSLPPLTAIKTNFLTTTAAARHMIERRSGVILTMSSTAAGLSGRDRVFHTTGGFAVACTAVEALSRTLAGEVGKHNIRVICLRSDALPETWPLEGRPPEIAEVEKYMNAGTARGLLPRLSEIADAASFAASSRAAAMTGTILNLTCGSVMDSN